MKGVAYSPIAVLLVIFTAAFSGCGSQNTSTTVAPGFLVPQAAWSQGTQISSATVSDARHVLPLSRGMAEPFFSRNEKYVTVPGATYQSSAFTDYKYEAEPIGLPGGYGYIYHYSVRTGVTGP